jgi:hypothetical protein
MGIPVDNNCTECKGVTFKDIVSYFDNFELIKKYQIKPIPADEQYVEYSQHRMAQAESDWPCGSWWGHTKMGLCATACSIATTGVGTALCGVACWCRYCPNSWLAKKIC